MIKIRLPDGQPFMIPGSLKPCPYCGNENVELKIAGSGAGYYVECEVYACNRPGYKIYSRAMDAVKGWNNGSN